MSRDGYLDRGGDEVDVVVCDYCDDAQAESRLDRYAVLDWMAAGWDIDPRPGRDRCPDCANHADQADHATTNPAGRVEVPAGVP